jgi:hypothetical protein
VIIFRVRARRKQMQILSKICRSCWRCPNLESKPSQGCFCLCDFQFNIRFRERHGRGNTSITHSDGYWHIATAADVTSHTDRSGIQDAAWRPRYSAPDLPIRTRPHAAKRPAPQPQERSLCLYTAPEIVSLKQYSKRRTGTLATWHGFSSNKIRATTRKTIRAAVAVV